MTPLCPSIDEAPGAAAPQPSGDVAAPVSADVPDSAADNSVFVFPATQAQRRFWLLDQLQPGGNSALNVPLALWLSGPLNRRAVEAALREIVHRQEALRTTFHCEEGQLVQLIAPSIPFDLELVDARDFPATERDRVVPHLIDEEAHRPFDLARGPLVRARLVRAGEEEHFLLLTLHHIICDGWSNGVLLREFSALYGAYLHNAASPLPELPIQFADYAEWQQQALETSAFADSLAYWRRQLEGALPALDLPTDRPRRPRADRRVASGAMQSLLLRGEFTRTLRSLSVREGVSPFMLFLAAFQILLHRYTGETDLILSTPSANRSRQEIEGLIGLFVNPLILRLDLSGDPTIRELLGRVRRMALDAFSHAELPFERLVEELRPERLPVSFLYQTAFLQPTDLAGGLKLMPLPAASGGVLFELTGAVLEEPGGTRVCIEYNAELFDTATIARLLGHYQMLLEGIVADPLTRLSAIPLLSVVERRQCCPPLAAPSALEGADSSSESLQALFASRAAESPRAIACKTDAGTLTFATLASRARRVAQGVASRAASGPLRVGIWADSAEDALVALAASLQMDGVAVPLDARTIPPDGALSSLSVLITSSGRQEGLLRERLPSERVLTVAGLAASATGTDEAALAAPAACFSFRGDGDKRETLARHQILGHRYRSLGESYDLQNTDRVGCTSAIGSWAGVEEIFSAWLAGAAVVPAPGGLLAGPAAAWRAWLERERISVLHLPAAAWERLVLSLAARTMALPETLRLVIVAESAEGPVCGKVLSAWQALPPVSEGRLRCIAHRGWVRAGGTALVNARGAAGCRLMVLDPCGQPVPAGVPGELCVEGRDLPSTDFAFDGPASLVRTGELARWRADGSVERLGTCPSLEDARSSRGLLMACRQSELVLCGHERVRQVRSVLASANGTGGPRVPVSYVVLAPSSNGTNRGSLVRFLKERLPEEWLSAAVLPVEEFPLTADGELDQAALPALSVGVIEPVEAPYLTLQHQIIEIWRDLLGDKPIGINDDFFSLGGTSLLAMRMLHRIENVCGKRIMPATLFTKATVEHLAAEIAKQASEEGPPILKIRDSGGKTPFFYLHGDLTGGGFYSLKLSAALGQDQPFYAMPPQDVSGASPWDLTVEAMAAAHYETIRGVRPHGPYVVGGFCIGGLVAFELARQIEASGERVERLIIIDAQVAAANLSRLRLLVNTLGALARWDNRERLARFSRYWYLQARLERWLGLERKTQKRILSQRLGDLFRRMTRFLRPRGGSGDQPAVSVRWDVPTVFLWATGGYRAKSYDGPTTLLLSRDLITGPHNPTPRWRRRAPNLTVHALTGSHLACITEHVDTLAKTIQSCLQSAEPPGAEGQRAAPASSGE